MWGWMFGWGWLAMGLMLLTLVALGVVAIVVVMRLVGGPWRPGARDDATGRSALEILEERFAKGEIDEEEFERRRAVLSS